MNIKWIAKKYGARAKKLLNQIKAACVERGLAVSDTYFLDADDYRWNFSVGNTENGQAVDVTLQVAESTECDGTDDGINFSLDIVAWGGEIVGGLTPYNYTDYVWVNPKDKQAVEDRFCLIEDSDTESAAKLINDFMQAKGWIKAQKERQEKE